MGRVSFSLVDPESVNSPDMMRSSRSLWLLFGIDLFGGWVLSPLSSLGEVALGATQGSRAILLGLVMENRLILTFKERLLVHFAPGEGAKRFVCITQKKLAPRPETTLIYSKQSMKVLNNRAIFRLLVNSSALYIFLPHSFVGP